MRRKEGLAFSVILNSMNPRKLILGFWNVMHLKVDFLSPSSHEHGAHPAPQAPRVSSGKSSPRTKKTTGRSPVKFFVSMVLFVATFGTSFLFGRASLSQSGETVLDKIPFLGSMNRLIGSADRKLQGEEDGRINILLLGMGGEGHEGPNLTDTLMVASIKPDEGKVAIISIPRDLLVPLPKYGWRKINSANAFGELQATGQGAHFARETLEGLLGMDIPYYIRVDFAGFKSLIDSVGGVDVHVDKAFTDYTYPTNDYGIQVIRFKEGWQKMDGETALKFARSRHGNNGEGSDFARATRQQKVISALKEKMLKASTFKNPTTVANTLAALQSNISTNLQIGEILRLARVAQRVTPADISRVVIDNGPGSPLVDSMVGGAYVLVPRNDDWEGLRTIAANAFEDGTIDDSPAEPPVATASAEKPRVEIQNGSGKAGQARTFATNLAAAGFQVVRIGNADSFGYDESVIFDLTKGQKGEELAKLQSATKAKQTKSGPPSGLAENALSGVDFVFVIGKNAL